MELFDDMLARQGQQRLQRARVVLTPSQSSWVSLPAALAGQLLSKDLVLPVVLRATQLAATGAPAGRPLYLAWSGGVAATPGVVEVPSALGRALGLPGGVTVLLEVCGGVQAAEVVVVEPAGPSDWEVLELNAGLLEEHLLSQVAVASLSQPLVVWARQAVVKLRCTALQPHGLTLARLTPGTELAIAPKPRLGPAVSSSTGSSNLLAANHVRNSSSAAPAGNQLDSGAAGTTQQQQQQGRYRDLTNRTGAPPADPAVQVQAVAASSTWLRVVTASANRLLLLQQQEGAPAEGPPCSSTAAQGCNNLSGHTNSTAAGSNQHNSRSSGVGCGVGVTSWMTTAVWVNSATARDQGLQPGAAINLQAHRGSSSGNGVEPSSGLLKELVVRLLTDDALAWGHVALSPPLQLVLGLQQHDFVQLQQHRVQPPPAVELLESQLLLSSCLPMVLRPLVVQPSTASAGAARGPSKSRGAATLLSVLNEAAGRGAADGEETSSQQQQLRVGRSRYVSTELQPVDSLELPPAAAASGAAAGAGRAAAKSEVNVWTVLQGLLPQNRPATAAATSSSPSSGTASARAPAAQVATAAGAGSGGSSTQDSWQRPLLQLPEGAAAAALAAWLRLQLAAAAVTGAAATPAAGRSPAAAGSSGTSAAGAVSSSSQLLMPHTLVMHLRAANAAVAAGSSCGDAAVGRVAVGPGLTEVDHLLLVLPQLPGQLPSAVSAALWQLPSSYSAAAAGLHWQLSAAAVEQLSAAPGRPDGQLSVDWAKPLSLPASLDQREQYMQHVQALHGPLTPTSSSSSSSSLPPAHVPGPQPSDFPWLQQAVAACQQRLLPKLSLKVWAAWQAAGLPLGGGVLLSGSSGAGKSAVLQMVGAAAGGDAASGGVEVLLVSCQGLAGSSFSAAAQVLASATQQLLSRCPGLLLLDDLDLLCPAPAEGPEGGMGHQDGEVAVRLAEWLGDLLRWASSQPRPLGFMATVKAAAALAPTLRAAGCFDQEVKLPVAGAVGRSSMLAAGVRAREWRCGPEVLQEVADATEGFDARDLQLLLDRAGHAALCRRLANTARAQLTAPEPTAAAAASTATAAAAAAAAASGTPGKNSPTITAVTASAGGLAGVGTGDDADGSSTCLTKSDFDQALEGYTPGAFRAVGGYAATQQGKGAPNGALEGWQDVGGMQGARAALHEALELPLRFGHLLTSAPLRLRTGLLLYGPPGCGKTHIVAAAVAATGARLVSVKGPELLNKYIGQSEASVREVFGRAAAAAPCVLFFDEFDAIAPPRGHDSTGVTDRVVNQLLTELDGVEGLKGVTVLAATSRPDLIDAALLRPGRLDRQVYCGLPDQQERYDVLQAAARKLPLAADVDLAAVAGLTEHFTCADLTALLSEAQLLAVHDVLDAQLAAQASGPQQQEQQLLPQEERQQQQQQTQSAQVKQQEQEQPAGSKPPVQQKQEPKQRRKQRKAAQQDQGERPPPAAAAAVAQDPDSSTSAAAQPPEHSGKATTDSGSSRQREPTSQGPSSSSGGVGSGSNAGSSSTSSLRRDEQSGVLKGVSAMQTDPAADEAAAVVGPAATTGSTSAEAAVAEPHGSGAASSDSGSPPVPPVGGGSSRGNSSHTVGDSSSNGSSGGVGGGGQVLQGTQAVAGDSIPPGGPLITWAHVRRALARARTSLPPAEASRLEAIYSRFRDSRAGGQGGQSHMAEEPPKRATLA